MPLISRLRLTNIEYDRGKKVLADELLRFDSRNALVNLANGGGKTLLLQLIMQVVLPNEPLNKRAISDLLTHKRYTGHVCVEWKLDAMEQSYLLTGFCFTSAREEEGRCRYFTYLIEYREANEFDIRHLPLMQDRVPLGYYELWKLLKGNTGRRDAQIQVFAQDERRRYWETLRTYFIYEKEWRGIKLTNGTEGGMEKFFQDTRTTRQLLEKLLIPAVEEVMFTNPEQAKDLAKNFTEYRKSLMRIPELQKNLNDFAAVRAGGEQVLGKVREFSRNQQAYREGRGKVRCLYNSCCDALVHWQKTTEELQENLQATNITKDEMLYRQDSLPYARKMIELHQAVKARNQVTNDLSRVSEEKDRLDYRWRLGWAQNKWLEIVNWRGEIEGLRVSLDELHNNNREQLSWLDLCRATLRLRLQEELEKRQGDLRQQEASREKLRQEQDVLRKRIEKLSAATEKLARYEAVIKHSLKEHEKKLHQQIKIFTFTWVWEPETGITELEQGAARQKEALNVLKEEEKNIFARLDELGEELVEIATTKSTANAELQRLETDLAGYVEKEDHVKTLLVRHSLEPTDLFTRRENILGRLNQQIIEWRERLSRLTGERKLLEDQVELLSGHDYYVPNSELVRVQQQLAEWGIEARPGSGWLQSLGINREQYEAYLRHSPLLPYALVIAAEDLKRLQGKEREWQEITLTCPVPLIVHGRQMEPASVAIPAGGSPGEALVPAGTAPVEVYLAWHKGYSFAQSGEALDEVRRQVEADLARCREGIAGAEASLEALRYCRQELDQFLREYNEKTASALQKQRLKMEDQLKELHQKESQVLNEQQSAKSRQPMVGEEINALEEKLWDTENRLSKLKEWQQAEVEAGQKHQVRERCIYKLGKMRQRVKELTQDERAKTQLLEEMAGRLRDLSSAVGNLAQQLDEVKQPQKPVAQEEDWALEQARSAWEKAEALAAGRHKDLAVYEERISNFNDYIARNEKDINRLSVPQEEVQKATLPFPEAELDCLEKELGEQKLMVKQLEEKEQSAKTKLVELETEARMIAENITKIHGRQPWTDYQLYGMKLDGGSDVVSDIEPSIWMEPGLASELERIDKVLQAQLSAIEEKVTRLGQELEQVGKAHRIIDKTLVGLEGTINTYRVEESDERWDESTWPETEENLPAIAGNLGKELLEVRDQVDQAKEQCRGEYQKYAMQLRETENSVVFKFMNHLLEEESRQLDLAVVESGFDKLFQLIDNYEEKLRLELDQLKCTKQELVNRCVQHAERVAANLRDIDRYTRFDYGDNSIRAVRIKLKDWDQEHAPAVMEQHIDKYILDLKEMVDKEMPDELLEKHIEKQMSSRQLLNVLSDLEKCRIQVLKPQQHKDKPAFDNWEMVQKWSGGERFAGYTAMFMAIISFTRGKMSGQRNPPKVLLADNPFGVASSPHVLEVVFGLARSNNFQMICLTALTEDSIYAYFPVVYSLCLRQSFGREYMHAQTESSFYDLGVSIDMPLKRQPTLQF